VCHCTCHSRNGYLYVFTLKSFVLFFFFIILPIFIYDIPVWAQSVRRAPAIKCRAKDRALYYYYLNPTARNGDTVNRFRETATLNFFRWFPVRARAYLNNNSILTIIGRNRTKDKAFYCFILHRWIRENDRGTDGNMNKRIFTTYRRYRQFSCEHTKTECITIHVHYNTVHSRPDSSTYCVPGLKFLQRPFWRNMLYKAARYSRRTIHFF
jgi:hypothetical protein